MPISATVPPPSIVTEQLTLGPPMVQYPTLPIHRSIHAVQPGKQTPAKAKIEMPQTLPEEPPPIKRYYGRKRPGDTSDSDEDVTGAAGESDEDNSNDDDNEDHQLMDAETSSDKSYPFPHSSGLGAGFGVGSLGTSGKQNSKNLLTSHGTNLSSSTETKVSKNNNNLFFWHQSALLSLILFIYFFIYLS